MKLQAHLNTSALILEKYTGQTPFVSYLKEYFKQNKKHGSSDRKNISAFCYAFFRTGKAFEQQAIELKIAAGLFLISNEPTDLLDFLNGEWNKMLPLATEKKIQHLKNNYGSFSELLMFPYPDRISGAVSKTDFILSHLELRNVFIRARPGKEQKVNKTLKEHSVEFERLSTNCFSLVPGFKIEKYFTLDNEIVVQDYSSQQTVNLISEMNLPDNPDVWDCCAASGGKSIMAHDTIPKINLTVSDIRQSILINLRKRFREAGIDNYQMLVADVQKQSIPAFEKKFDCIIADVPCSGSGTWGRTPELLYHFDVKRVEQYSALQRSIVKNVSISLKPGGYMLYITCSVYKQENEDVVEFITAELGLRLLKQQVIEGYEERADTMFAALLQLP